MQSFATPAHSYEANHCYIGHHQGRLAHRVKDDEWAELKVSSLLATPDEANQSHHEATLAQRVVPNEGSAKLGHGLAHSHEVNTQAAWVLTSQRGQPLVDVAGSPTGAASQLDALRELADLL